MFQIPTKTTEEKMKPFFESMLCKLIQHNIVNTSQKRFSVYLCPIFDNNTMGSFKMTDYMYEYDYG